MEIVTSEEMQRIDRHAIRSMRIPSLLLMERAGIGVVEAMRSRFPDLRSRRILVVCGKGNNGGDGLVVARHLRSLGLSPLVVLAATPASLKGDAKINHAAARGAGVAIESIPTTASWAAFARKLPDFDLLVDALLGTGLRGPADGLPARIIEDVTAFNDSHAGRLTIVAVDLPSGLSGNSSEVPGAAFRAELSVALCRPKISHLLPPACLLAGRVEVADIGIPATAVGAVRPKVFSIESSDLRGLLPVRPRDAHKGTYGHALIVAGSEGKAGAAALASRAALRAGAGLATVATPAAVRPEVASFSAEVMTVGLPDGPARATVVRLLAETEGKTALAVGPGLGHDPTVVEWIRRFVAASALPLVLDADGLNAFEGHVGSLSGARRPIVLTPHPGEMARLTGSSTQEILADRIGAARSLARSARAIVVLKGMATLVAAPDGRVFVNRTGNPGMATGGTGDVLTGVLAGLLARRIDPLASVLLGVHAHGRAGDLAAESLGEEGLMAGDVLEHLPLALKELAG